MEDAPGEAKVIHVLGSAEPAGSAQVEIVAALGGALARDGYRLRGWFTGKPGPGTSRLVAAGVPTRHLSFSGASDPVGGLRFARALVAERPAIVHFHTGGRVLIQLARRLTRAKLVGHLHGTHDERGEPIRFEPFVTPMDATVATSHAVAEAAGGNATVVYPAVRVPESDDQRGRAPLTIGTVGRLEPIKGLDRLLQATTTLLDRHPEMRTEIFGDGSDRERLEAMAAQLGISSSVHFRGWEDDPFQALRGLSVFVISSRHEGFGIAALEAMAAGLPVVASATGGLCELVVEGETGFLVPPGDSAALAARIGLLLDRPDLRDRMGAAGIDRARNRFSVSRMADATKHVYDRLLSRPPTSPRRR